MAAPKKISLDEWDERYTALHDAGILGPAYGGPLGRHLGDGDLRLRKLEYDDSPAALRLWNFLLTEEDRLREARAAGKKIVGTMKDLGTVPVIAYASPELVAFYPDGAWWIPCIMEFRAGLLAIADGLGIDDSFCPVRAMLGAFETKNHFPVPDLLTCSVGATCDDFSAIAQRLERMGHPILWWEMPHRRSPEPGEPSLPLPGTFSAPASQVALVAAELERIRGRLAELAGAPITDDMLAQSIKMADRVRDTLAELRNLVYSAQRCPLPALEMLVAEMLAIHYCSDREETLAVLEGLLAEVRRRIHEEQGVLPQDAARIFWVNPVADLRVMNLLEACGGRVCGTEYMFCHALDHIPEDLPPIEALARTALADPMVGPARDRARRICADLRRFGAEALLISRIPGASHCATEGTIIHRVVEAELNLPVLEMETPPVCDSMLPTLRTRLEALVETVKEHRRT